MVHEYAYFVMNIFGKRSIRWHDREYLDLYFSSTRLSRLAVSPYFLHLFTTS